MDEGLIRFVLPDGMHASARSDRGHHQQRRRIIPVGWDHPSVPPELAEHAELARAFGEAMDCPSTATEVECDDMRA